MPTQSITTLSNANHTFSTTALVFKNLQRSYLLPINSCITERRKNWTLNGQRRNLRYVLSWGTSLFSIAINGPLLIVSSILKLKLMRKRMRRMTSRNTTEVRFNILVNYGYSWQIDTDPFITDTGVEGDEDHGGRRAADYARLDRREREPDDQDLAKIAQDLNKRHGRAAVRYIGDMNEVPQWLLKSYYRFDAPSNKANSDVIWTRHLNPALCHLQLPMKIVVHTHLWQQKRMNLLKRMSEMDSRVQ